MILSPEQRDFFYMLYDTITVYANDQLQVTDHMFYGDPQMVDEYEQTKVAMELWKAPSLVDDFVASGDHQGLMPDEVDELAKWDKAIEGNFAVVVQPNGRALFLSDGCAFDVVGINREIGELLGRTPTFVNAALIPFDGLIVYGGYLNELPAGGDERAAALVQMQVQSMLGAGEVVSTADQFVQVSQRITEARVQREVDSMFDDLDVLGDESGVTGTHRGALAGLSAEERKRAVEQHVGSFTDADLDALQETLSEVALVDEPFDDLKELLLTQKKAELEWLAQTWGVKGFSSLSKKKLAGKLVDALAGDADKLRSYVGNASGQQLSALAGLYEAGGRMDVPVAELAGPKGLATLPMLFEPVVYTFLHDGRLTAVIPHELMEPLGTFDWADIRREAALRERIGDFADSLAELRGIVELQEAFDEFERLSSADGQPDAAAPGLDFDEFRGVLEKLATGGSRDFELLESGGVRYVVFYDLADEYEDALEKSGGYREASGEHAYLHGPLSPMLNGILENRRGKVARPLEPEMAKRNGVLDWELALPPVIALRGFFDANVPEGKNDYSFGDDMVDMLCTMAHGGYAPQDYFESLQKEGFFIDEKHLKRFMQLMQSTVSAVPSWFENGWSPVEMLEMTTGLKTFYNEDGTPMKIGKNDPCPCGSGKMYKDCHGRPRGGDPRSM